MINAPTSDRFSRIYGVGGYRPSRVVSNEEMCTMVESTPQWIQQRTGIVERRWATEDETIEVMALAAARKAIEAAGIEPTQLGAVIISTVSHLYQTPSLAAKIAAELGCDHPAAWDISGACAGFCYLIGQADALVRAHSCDYVLVLGAERLSQQTDVTDRGTAFLLADGAGAVVVGPSETPGIGPTVWGSEGEHWDVIRSKVSWDDTYDTHEWPWITMEGNKVFKWAITTVAQKAKEALAASGLSPDELDVFIPHQANNRIIDSMLKHLDLPESVVVARDIVHLGNTSAASIPLAMESLLDSGQASSGQTALMIGFGAGLVYAGQVVALP